MMRALRISTNVFLPAQVSAFEFFANNTNLTLLYKIDIDVFQKHSAKQQIISSGN